MGRHQTMPVIIKIMIILTVLISRWPEILSCNTILRPVFLAMSYILFKIYSISLILMFRGQAFIMNILQHLKEYFNIARPLIILTLIITLWLTMYSIFPSRTSRMQNNIWFLETWQIHPMTLSRRMNTRINR